MYTFVSQTQYELYPYLQFSVGYRMGMFSACTYGRIRVLHTSARRSRPPRLGRTAAG